jgi:hypothetical protein
MLGGRTNRRAFIAALGGAAAWPIVTRAQQPAVPVIGYVVPGLPNTFPNLTLAFQQGLNESGFTEGQSVIVQRRFADGHFERLPDLVTELASLPVNVIVLASGPFPALRSAARGVPIVTAFGGDPVRSGLVSSLYAGISIRTCRSTSRFRCSQSFVGALDESGNRRNAAPCSSNSSCGLPIWKRMQRKRKPRRRWRPTQRRARTSRCRLSSGASRRADRCRHICHASAWSIRRPRRVRAAAVLCTSSART